MSWKSVHGSVLIAVAVVVLAGVTAGADLLGNEDTLWRLAPGGGSVGVTTAEPVIAPVAPADGSMEPTGAADREPVGLPPIVSLTASVQEVPTGEVVRFDAGGSTDADGRIVLYRWDLYGDGQFATTTSVPMLPFPYLDNGERSVRVRVVDDDGNATTSDAITITVTNRAPEVELLASATAVTTGQTVGFDASASRDSDGRIVTFFWDLDGDGTFEQETEVPTAVRTYDDDGRYLARVRVVDDDGAEATSDDLLIDVANRPPSASFAAAAVAFDGDAVAFVSTAADPDGEVVRWSWMFGDGTASAEEGPTHRFDDDGIYTVTLVAGDDDGAQSEPASRDIEIRNALPVAVLRASSRTVSVGEELTFHDVSTDPSPEGSILNIGIDFGDGTYVSGGPLPDGSYVHVYAAPGEYAVRLYAIDDDGGMSSATITITVE